MTFRIIGIDHVQIAVPGDRMAAALAFYGGVLGLPEIPQPARDTPEPGAWYDLGTAELHLRPDAPEAGDGSLSRRHVALAVTDLDAVERAVRDAGTPILPDRRPVPGQRRLFVRDPGGNRLELVERRP